MRLIKLVLGIVLVGFFATACSNDDVIPEKEELSLVGVWEEGSNFISFDEDGYYCAYLGDDFLDSGKYTQFGNNVTTKNDFYARESRYSIEQNESSIKLTVSSKDPYGNPIEKTLQLEKSEKTPAKETSPIVGKSTSWLTASFGYVSMSFLSNNSGLKTAQRGSAMSYPLSFYYVYAFDRVYYQTVEDDSTQIPTIGGWTASYYKTICVPVRVESNGSLWMGTSITI